MKRILIIGSCLLLILGCTACGKSSKKKSKVEPVTSGSSVELQEEKQEDFDPTYMPGEITDPAEAEAKLSEIFSVENPSEITKEELSVTDMKCYLYQVPFGSRRLKVPVYKKDDEEYCHYRVFVRQSTEQIIEDIQKPVEYGVEPTEESTSSDKEEEIKK